MSQFKPNPWEFLSGISQGLMQNVQSKLVMEDLLFQRKQREQQAKEAGQRMKSNELAIKQQEQALKDAEAERKRTDETQSFFASLFPKSAGKKAADPYAAFKPGEPVAPPQITGTAVPPPRKGEIATMFEGTPYNVPKTLGEPNILNFMAGLKGQPTEAEAEKAKRSAANAQAFATAEQFQDVTDYDTFAGLMGNVQIEGQSVTPDKLWKFLQAKRQGAADAAMAELQLWASKEDYQAAIKEKQAERDYGRDIGKMDYGSNLDMSEAAIKARLENGGVLTRLSGDNKNAIAWSDSQNPLNFGAYPEYTNALDRYGIKWHKGRGLPGEDGKETVPMLVIDGDPIEATRILLAETAGIQNWYGNGRDGGASEQLGIHNNRDFANASPEAQNAYMDAVFRKENNTGGLFEHYIPPKAKKTDYSAYTFIGTDEIYNSKQRERAELESKIDILNQKLLKFPLAMTTSPEYDAVRKQLEAVQLEYDSNQGVWGELDQIKRLKQGEPTEAPKLSYAAFRNTMKKALGTFWYSFTDEQVQASYRRYLQANQEQQQAVAEAATDEALSAADAALFQSFIPRGERMQS